MPRLFPHTNCGNPNGIAYAIPQPQWVRIGGLTQAVKGFTIPRQPILGGAQILPRSDWSPLLRFG